MEETNNIKIFLADDHKILRESLELLLSQEDDFTVIGQAENGLELESRFIEEQPDVLLMDEPFGAVDEITRRRLQEEILRIHEELGGTIVFVTHDIKEALKLGSRVLVMDHGNIIQDGSPTELLEHPATDFVRRLVAG